MKNNKSRVIIFGIVLTITLILVAVIGLPTLQPTNAAELINYVRTSNINEQALNISWVTSGDTEGEVRYGVDSDNLDLLANDERGTDIVDNTHYITLSQLNSNTTYYFDIYSNAELDDNGGIHYTVTTGPTIGIPTIHTVYGKVIKADSKTPAEGCVVYITLQDGDGAGSPGTAAPLSSIVDQDGWWYVNLAESRETNLGNYQQYSPTGDQISIEAACGNDGSTSTVIDTSSELPAPDLILSTTASDHFFLPFMFKK